MFAWQATVQDEFGNAVSLPVVTVYESDGVTLANIYADDQVTPLDNPFTGSLEGFVQFWANAGTYKIIGANGLSETQEWSVFLDTPVISAVIRAEQAAAAAESSALDAESAEVQTGLDRVATAADRVQTGLDRVATAADRVQTGLDAAATDADAIATASDRVQTGLDRVQTGADRTAAVAARDLSQGFAIDAAEDALAAQAAAASSGLMGRNLIVNGAGRINQRGYVSGTATVGPNQYTLDMWRVVVSGQNLAFTPSLARKVMTAPAGGVEQVVSRYSVVGGTYTINWFGTASCTVNGIARTKNQAFTLAADTAVVVRMIGGTFTDVQLELGTTGTTFEAVDTFLQQQQCETYYEIIPVGIVAAQNAGAVFGLNVSYRRAKPITTPSITFLNILYLNAATLYADLVGDFGFRALAVASATGSAGFVATAVVDASP